MKNIMKWVGIGIGGLFALGIVMSIVTPTPTVTVVMAEPTVTTQPAETTTTQPTTTTQASTTTTRPVTTTTRPPTTTTTVFVWSQDDWNEAAILTLSDSGYFPFFSDADILDSVRLVCDQYYEYDSGSEFVMSIALSGDIGFVEQVGAILGVLSVEPGCGNRSEQRFIEEATDFLNDFLNS